MSRVIIAGGRDFANHKLPDGKPDTGRNQADILLLHTSVDMVFPDPEIDLEVVSGGAPGADYHGEVYAEFHDYIIKRFPAEWEKYGKVAGPKRNIEMAEYADVLVAFWDGKSKGTKHMIDAALGHGLEVHVFRY